MGRFPYLLLPAVMLCIVSCMKQDADSSAEDFDFGPDAALFIVNEGGFGNGNSSLSVYEPESGVVHNNIFRRANGVPLGDVAQSMTVHDGKGWVVVNNSKVIFAIGLDDIVEKGRITGFVSPRNIAFVSDSKAYVTDMYSQSIYIVDPRTYSMTGTIETGCTTEQIIIHDGYAYVNFWSSGNEVLKIDTATDKVTDRIRTGLQPCSMALDANDRLWALTDGSAAWPDNPAGSEDPCLHRIDLESFSIDRTLHFDGYVTTGYSSVSRLQTDASGRHLLWLDGEGVWMMDIESPELPDGPLVRSGSGQTFYSMTVSPSDGDIYVSDAIDYSQNGKISRYSADGTLKDEFTAGICPGAFCWR